MAKFDVVISGVSGRFPDSDDLNTFERKLYKGEDFITFDERKWSKKFSTELGKKTVPHGTGKFCDVCDYDPMVFRLNQMFARSNDIINRKVLEPAFEAVVDAGINPYTLSGRNIGVFASYGVNERDNQVVIDDQLYLLLIGASKTMTANRISFAFDLRGPSYTFATDVYGNFEALTAAYRAILNEYIDAAIVVTCSNIFHPNMSLNYLDWNFLSDDAATRVFSKEASGFGRSEVCIAFMLQRSDEAKRIRAKVNICETYNDGLKMSTLLQYDEKFLKTAFENIYKNALSADVDPADLTFLEMNAFGVKKFDSIESNAVAEFFCKNKNTPLLVGSVKSNVGHAEAAAPFLSVLKALLAFQTGKIAANINVGEVNRQIKPFDNGTLQVVSESISLPGDKIGINAISLIGSVSHMVLQKHEKSESIERNNTISDELPRLLLICGRSQTNLIAAIEEIESKPFNAEFISLANDVFSINMPSHFQRGYTILPKTFTAIHEVQIRGEKERPIWYLFTGMGSQWNCMGEGLLELPIFADVVKRCDAVLKLNGIDIYKILTSDNPAIFDNIVNSFVGIITIQIALTEVLKAIGLKPDGIIGHSVGENACAYADGCLTLEQAVMASYVRGVASTEVKTVRGMMAAVGKGYSDLKDSLPNNVEIACHNSANSCTLSGPAEEVENFVAELQKQNIFAKTVNVANIAYHSKNIASAGTGLMSRLKKIITSPKERSSKWISTSVPEAEWDRPLAKSCSPEYLTNNLLNPVLFEEGCKHIPKDAIIVEIAPHGLLQAIVKKSLPESCTNIPLAKRTKTKNNLSFLLSAIGKLYIAGCNLNVNELFPKVSYPVSSNTPSLSPLCTWDHTTFNCKSVYLLPPRLEPVWGDLIRVCINEDSEYGYLRYHKVNDKVVIPIGFFIYLVWWIVSILKNERLDTIPILFEDLKIHRTITLSLKKPRAFTVMIQKSGYFEVLLNDEIIVTNGKVTTEVNDVKVTSSEQSLLPSGKEIKIEIDDFYDFLARVGYRLNDCFASIEDLSHDGTDYIGKIRWQGNWVAFLDSLMKLHMFSSAQMTNDLLYPWRVKKLFIFAPAAISNSQLSIGCRLNKIENVLHCCGLEMFGLKFKHLKEKRTSSIIEDTKYRCYEFVEYSNPLCQDIRGFLKICLQIIIENFALISQTEYDKLGIVEHYNSLTKTIVKLIKENDFLKTKTVFFSTEEISTKCLEAAGIKSVLDISSHEYIKSEFHVDEMFLLVTLRGSEKISQNVEQFFVEVTKQCFGDERFYFFKKKQITNGHPAQILMETESFDPNECNQYYNQCKDVIVRTQIETKDLTVILNSENKRNKRFLYLLDDENFLQKVNSIQIEDRLSVNLPVSVIRNGVWGFYKDVTEEMIRTERTTIENELHQLSFGEVSLKTATVHFFLMENDTENETKNNSQPISFSGVHTSGQNIIGITTINSFEAESDINPNFTWTVPRTWNLKEAATLPVTYAQAYNILALKMEGFRHRISMLINMGKELSLTEACISIALKHQYIVYVTVSNDQETKLIKDIFPQIENENILNAEICDYEIEILTRTLGKGVNMVVNCLPGSSNTMASLKCVTAFGIYIEMNETNFNDEYKLGLDPFLKPVSMYAVSHKISNLLNLCENDQKILKTAMQDGINTGVVKPFSVTSRDKSSRDIEMTKFHTQTVIRNSQNGKITEGISQKLHYGSEYSYIIVGNEKKSYLWLDYVEWLISKGVRKFILAINSFVMAPKVSYQLNRLVNQKDISIILTGNARIESVEKATELLDEAEKLGPVEAIFFINTESASKRIYSVDAALQNRKRSTYVISVFSGGLEACERRRKNGYPALVVHADNPKNISSLFSQLDDILSAYDSNISPTLYTVFDHKLKLGKTTENMVLRDHLAFDIKLLEDVGYRMTKRSQFVQVGSLSIPYDESIGVYPVFVIPSVRGDHLQPLIRKLLYPVFCATLAESDGTITDVTSDLFAELIKIQPTGPVTVIGETWSARIAIELSKLVELSDRKCKLLLIEGNPNKWRKLLRQLGEPFSSQFDVNFIKAALKRPEIIAETFPNLGDTFEKRLKTYLSTLALDESSSDHLIKALVALRGRLLYAAQYEPSSRLWHNVSFLLKNFSQDPSLKLSTTSGVHVFEEDDYEIFVRDPRIVRMVNENALFNWWDYTKCD